MSGGSNRCRETVEAIERVASAVGASVIFDRARRHPVAVLGFHGQTRRVFFSGTSSSPFASNYAARDVKRTLREMGAPL